MTVTYNGIEIPANDEARVKALQNYEILDTEPEIEYDDVTELAAAISGCRVAYITFFDEKRSWMKSKYGLPSNRPDRPRELSLCSPTICQSDLLIVPDLSENPRYANLPAVTNPPHAKFYCAMPLINPEGYALGTLCVWDPETKQLNPETQQCIRRLARQLMANLETRRRLIELRQFDSELQATSSAARTASEHAASIVRNLFPTQIAEKLMANEPVAPHFYGSATVLFVDFVEFSRLAEVLEPRELIEQLNDYFTLFDSITEKHGLDKIKTVGDAFLAVAGVPEETSDHALIACCAALEINSAMERANSDRRKLGLTEWQIRIGIHSGHLIAGAVGKKRVSYDIWGDGVNTARRMQEECEPNRINISEATYGLVAKKVKCEPRGRIEAKNKGEIEMYYLEGLA